MRELNTALGARALKMIRNADIYPIMMVLVWLPNVVVFTWHLVNNIIHALRQQGKDTSALNQYLIVVEGYTYLFGGLYGLLLAIGMLKFRWFYLYISISLYLYTGAVCLLSCGLVH